MEILHQIYEKMYTAYGPQYWWPSKDKNNRETEIIIGAILTQNTAWTNVEKALHNLRENNLIDFKKINKINSKKLANLIKSSGYYNQKAKKLKAFSDYLKKFDFDFDNLKKKKLNILREELLKIHGIGKETADSILLYALNKPIFVIDAYTKRIFQRLGLADEKTNYDDLQNLFEKNLTKDSKLFNEYHALLVRLGKDVCKKKPICNECPLIATCSYATGTN